MLFPVMLMEKISHCIEYDYRAEGNLFCMDNGSISINIIRFAISININYHFNQPAMNEVQIIQSKIYEIRGQKVMLDFDLAELYQVETRRLNEAVKRNIKRFPKDFMFQLNLDEWKILMSQFATSSWGGTRKLPYAFTEQGLAMLSGVLNSDIAIQVNINIMRAFVAIRQLIAIPPVDRIGLLETQMKELKEYIEEVFTDYNDINEDTRIQLDLINKTLAELQVQEKLSDKPRNPVGFVKPK